VKENKNTSVLFIEMKKFHIGIDTEWELL